MWLFSRMKVLKFGGRFKRIFGRSLQDFYVYPLGFDIVAFDEWLEVPDGESTSGFLVEHYGKEADEMVRLLL